MRANDPAAPSDLDLAPAFVTGRLDALERRGFVRRTPSPTDRRRVVVGLTPKARATWLGAMDVPRQQEVRLLGVLGEDQRALLDGMLRRIEVVAEGRDGTAGDAACGDRRGAVTPTAPTTNRGPPRSPH